MDADCIYLDPMFPGHKPCALPFGDLQILQPITDNQDMDGLFELALKQDKNQMIVKRPLHPPAMNEKDPDIVYAEEKMRFDVYFTNTV